MRKHLSTAVLTALTVGALTGGGLAIAAGENLPVKGGARNPSINPARSYTRETEIIANTSTFGTRQSNKSNNGGGAVYGCRSAPGGTERGNEPCIRASNLVGGRAFEFNSNGGTEVGRITGPANAAPFTTSATGVATGLNADRVDGLNAEQMVAAARAKEALDADTVDGLSSAQLRTRWAYVDETGKIVAQSGGFRVLDAYETNNNIYLDAGEDLTDNGITATIAIRNQGGTNFGGEISASRCQIPDVVECAPPSSKNVAAFVVSPRNSDGSATSAGARKPFHVVITE